jgi:uncharacterized membrane protein YedE/YeeE
MTLFWRTATAWLAGCVLGMGLLISQMADPLKVLNFLDVTGHFDPGLAFVMLGAVWVMGLVTWLTRGKHKTVLGLTIQRPARQKITLRLCVGSVVFGVGWGLAGFCPAPAIVAMGMGYQTAWWFGSGMGVGMLIFAVWNAAKN